MGLWWVVINGEKVKGFDCKEEAVECAEMQKELNENSFVQVVFG